MLWYRSKLLSGELPILSVRHQMVLIPRPLTTMRHECTMVTFLRRAKGQRRGWTWRREGSTSSVPVAQAQ